jgi:hypothetical protein
MHPPRTCREEDATTNIFTPVASIMQTQTQTKQNPQNKERSSATKNPPPPLPKQEKTQQHTPKI